MRLENPTSPARNNSRRSTERVSRLVVGPEHDLASVFDSESMFAQPIRATSSWRTVDCPANDAKLQRRAEDRRPRSVSGSQQEPQEPSKTPAAQTPAATRAIDFANDIKPLFARSCLGCHGEKDAKSSFSLTSRSALVRGGDSELTLYPASQ